MIVSVLVDICDIVPQVQEEMMVRLDLKDSQVCLVSLDVPV